ncbi:hypothetical protein EJ070_23870 [Mesorhizobium sp. M1E.F.Ca.ET.045.02.1.1]|nr:hypothetical protein EJ070_23870 [Mesorhizobium sp. M1E.F.Ca.ET.045.02.1.1]RUW76414.1 hypothetical protein EOA29_27780 [Mesorhizobium sp. M1E.F.Ca.ET.063.01.1.1]RWD94352.1 MAG: hypothetical protein EOS39_07760 [Mesorhizobium sp.]TIV48025.1 MAG: hypothetical protein E5V88_30545 [Mesorhizobium sp.]
MGKRHASKQTQSAAPESVSPRRALNHDPGEWNRFSDKTRPCTCKALSRDGPILIVSGKPSSVSPFHRNGEPLYLFVLTQFRAENRYALFLELL